ncbi:MAG: cation transporter [Actinomycetota bacterium]|nr:cation transporter [Actinomycetota bacterium]
MEQQAAALSRRARRLEYGTTVWNSLEAVVAISTGVATHSLALVAFGLDSCVEVMASIVVLWHLGGATEEVDPARTRRAMRLIAVAFGVLGVYLSVEAVRNLVTRSVSEPPAVGMVFMAATVVVMFGLARAKRRTGVALGSRPLIANASMTLVDGCLAGAILFALVADRLAGWWWADPLAAGIVALIALNEARENWTSGPEPAAAPSD